MYYTFQHITTITKLSQDVIQYYKNIISLIGANANTKRYTTMNSIKGTHELQKENSRGELGARKDRATDWSTTDPLPLRHSNQQESTTVQALGYGHAGPGESES